LAPSKPPAPISHADVWPNGYLFNIKPGYERPPESWELPMKVTIAAFFVMSYFGLKYGPDEVPRTLAAKEVERRKTMRAEGTDPWTEDMYLDLKPRRKRVPPFYYEDGIKHFWMSRRRFLKTELEDRMNKPYPPTRINL